MQDSPQEGAPTFRGGRQQIKFAGFLKNCMKLGKFWSVGGGGARRGSATAVRRFKNLTEHKYRVRTLPYISHNPVAVTHVHDKGCCRSLHYLTYINRKHYD